MHNESLRKDVVHMFTNTQCLNIIHAECQLTKKLKEMEDAEREKRNQEKREIDDKLKLEMQEVQEVVILEAAPTQVRV